MTVEHTANILSGANQTLASIPLPRGTRPVRWQELDAVATKSTSDSTKTSRTEMLPLRIELGRTQMPRQDALQLRSGAVVPLDNPAADPVDIYAAGRLIARGEVLAIEGKVGVRITELVSKL